MKKILIILLLLHSQVSFSQNLVPNPSFENYTSCPTATDQVDSVVDWFRVTQSPDYFNSCTSVTQLSVPSNFTGYQPAVSGNAYCGMVCYYPNDQREYIGAQLTNSLLVGQKYFVSFSLNLANNFYLVGCNKFGCKLSTIPFSYNTILPDNQAKFYSDSIITDTLNWIFIKGSFVADSAYNYIAFGNFFDNANTDTLMLSAFNSPVYLYIDEVCLSSDSILCSEPNIVSEIEHYVDIKISPNPCTLSFSISSGQKINSLKLLNLLGEEILVNNTLILPFTQKIIDVSRLAKGIYILRLNTCKKLYTEKIVIK